MWLHNIITRRDKSCQMPTLTCASNQLGFQPPLYSISCPTRQVCKQLHYCEHFGFAMGYHQSYTEAQFTPIHTILTGNKMRLLKDVLKMFDPLGFISPISMSFD